MTIWKPTLPSNKAAYLALADAIERDKASGALAAGTKLPPHRNLAFDLGLTVGTITRGFAEAARRGLVRGEVGRGTFVADPIAPELRDEAFVRRVAYGDDILNLTITRPAVDVLLTALEAGIGQLARQDLLGFADYGQAEGQVGHREAVASWLQARNAPISADRVVISSGAQNALALAAAGLLRPGDTVAVDPLTYPGFKSAAGLFALNLVPITGDADGMLPDALLTAAQGGARAVYLMPTLHNPTMATMPLQRRQAIAAVAEEANLLILEDDVYGFLAENPLPLFSVLAPHRTALIGSVSKFMAPALRIGWIAPPEDRVAEVTSALRGLAWMASPLMAEVVTAAMVTGEATMLAERQRAEATARMALVSQHLGRWLPDLPPAAMHVWMPLPEPWRADVFVAEAEARRVAVTGAGAFTVGRARTPHSIRFGLGPATRDRLEEGLETLASLLSAPPRASSAVV
jgi:DNA-binding transcriptional MocR family regulator